ncbi:MAG: SRPBCC domain-containing protein [Alphaproteobacteria bacterium]|nr:SRPBCC domain-containing protein [Alphaproteobacteria bacterium]MDE2111752.1 SRPBCC domain-containing protein [Alphaproteobacteria bacterium]MDE2494917.1 SRPBCC domain-containing protein [Alphaproteobacteria bacterium]
MSDTVLSLEIIRRFEAPPERVFDAWLSKSWGDWIGPRAVKGEVTLLEPKVGGRYRVVMHRPDDPPLTVEGVYREIVRPTKLVFTWTWMHEERETLVRLTFRPVGAGTEMTIHHEGFSTTERRDGHNNGWNGTFDKLAAYLAEGAK